MRAENCREWRESLGAHALGRLPEEERAALQAHLDGCPDCRAELESLVSVARLLPLADPDRLGVAPSPPASLADRIAAAIAAERRTALRLRLGFAASAAAVAAVATLLAFLVLPGDGGPEPERQVDFGSLPPGLKISATLLPHAYGTEVHLYVKGVRSGTLCRVFLRSRDGSRLPAGSFRYRRGEDSRAVLSSALPLSRAESIGVRIGRRTFTAPVTAAPRT